MNTKNWQAIGMLSTGYIILASMVLFTFGTAVGFKIIGYLMVAGFVGFVGYLCYAILLDFVDAVQTGGNKFVREKKMAEKCARDRK